MKKRQEAVLYFSIGVLCIVLTSLPLFGDGNMYTADDVWYHLLRIENVKQGLLAGQFPVRMGTNYLNHHGYGASLCYPELFLYLPAVLQIIGVSTAASFKLFIIFLNVLTYTAMYFCGRKISGQPVVGAIAAIIVMLSPYHLANIYLRGAIGEVQAYIFFPLVIYSLYDLVFGEFEYPIVMGIGFWGLVYSHSISLVIALITALITSLVFFKRVFLNKKKVIGVLCTAGITLLASCSYWLPFLEQLASNTFKFSHPWTSVSIQGVSWRRLLSVVQDRYNFGLLLIALSAIVGIKYFVCKLYAKRSNDYIIWALVSAICLLFCATKYFPWKLVEPVLNGIQFPWRFYAIATVFMGIAIGGGLIEGKTNSSAYRIIIIAIVLAMFTINGLYYLRKNPIGYVTVGVESYVDPKDTFNIVQEEWLPEQVQLNDLRGERHVFADNGQSIPFITRYDGTLVFETDGKSNFYVVPLLWYKGYTAIIQMENGDEERLNLAEDESTGKIALFIESEVRGTISVWYEGTMIQKVTDFVTLGTWIGVAAYVGKTRHIMGGKYRKKIDAV